MKNPNLNVIFKIRMVLIAYGNAWNSICILNEVVMCLEILTAAE